MKLHRRQEQQGRRPTRRSIPKNIVQWGFEPQRDDLRRGRGAFCKGRFARRDDGKTVQIPDAWAAAWKWFYNGDVDRPLHHDRARVPGAGLQRRWLPVLHRQGRDAARTTCGRRYGVDRRRRRLGPGGDPVVQRHQTTAAFNADTFRILKGTKHPDEAFTVLQLPARRRRQDPAAQLDLGGFPARKADQPAFFSQLEQQKDDKGKLIYPPTSTGRWSPTASPFADIDPNFESSCPPTTSARPLLGQVPDQVDIDAGLDMDAEIRQAQDGAPGRSGTK